MAKYIILVIIVFICIAAHSQIDQFDISDEQYALPDLVMGKNGEGYIVMIWTDYRDAWFFLGDEDEGAVYGQIYDPDLNPVGANFRISNPSENRITVSHNLDLLVLDDRRFVVTWLESVRNGDGIRRRRIVMTMLNWQGEALIQEQSVNDQYDDLLRSNPIISMVPGNRFLITWIDSREGYINRYGQYYDTETGNALGENVRLNPEGIPPQKTRQYMLSEERYMLIYSNRYIQYYDENDIPVGDPIDIVKTYNVGHSRLSVFHPFGADSLMILHGSLYSDQMWFSFADLDGTPLSEPVLINDNEPLQMNTELRIALNERNRSFILVWEDRRNSFPRRLALVVADIYAQRYDEKAQPVGVNFKVNHESREKNQLNPQVIYHRGDHFKITWNEWRVPRCPDPYGGLIVNEMSAVQKGLYLDFNDPVPGKVWGWENWLELIESQCGRNRPKVFQILGNYPNPFNNTTNIVFKNNYAFVINVEIQIFDILGLKIRTIQPAEGFGYGRHEVIFNASALPSGLYIARITSPQVLDLSDTIKLLLIK
jgi:hypothetical protein